MVRTVLISIITLSAVFGCKSPKAVSEYVSPHTDTIKTAVFYQEDSIELYVQKITNSDSLFNLKVRGLDFAIQNAQQKGNTLFLTVKSYNGCQKVDFEVYQHSIVFKSSPPRLRMRLAKKEQSKCSDENNGQVAFFTVACDVSDILNKYGEATIVFTNPATVARIKKQ